MDCAHTIDQRGPVVDRRFYGVIWEPLCPLSMTVISHLLTPFSPFSIHPSPPVLWIYWIHIHDSLLGQSLLSDLDSRAVSMSELVPALFLWVFCYYSVILCYNSCYTLLQVSMTGISDFYFRLVSLDWNLYLWGFCGFCDTNHIIYHPFNIPEYRSIIAHSDDLILYDLWCLP